MSAATGFEEFVTIVRTGSVTAAAAELGLPRPTLSRRLARLEERLGVRLLHRSTRRHTLTPEGEALYAQARQVVRDARAAEAMVRRLDGVPRGLLRVSLPTEMPQDVFSGWVIDFMTRFPEVQVELVASSAHVDLVAEGFDVAMRVGPIEDDTLIARTLTQNEHIAVATPEYLERRGTPEHVEDLAGHECIVGFHAGTVPEYEWPMRGGGSVRVNGRFASNQMGIRLASARRHLGIALVTERLMLGDLESGALVPILRDHVGRSERVRLVYPEREYLDPKVEAFVDHIVSVLAETRRMA